MSERDENEPEPTDEPAPPTPTERYEALAAAFRAETGLMAPGKDAPAEIAASYEKRVEAWGEWLRARSAARWESL